MMPGVCSADTWSGAGMRSKPRESPLTPPAETEEHFTHVLSFFFNHELIFYTVSAVRTEMVS